MSELKIIECDDSGIVLLQARGVFCGPSDYLTVAISLKDIDSEIAKTVVNRFSNSLGTLQRKVSFTIIARPGYKGTVK